MNRKIQQLLEKLWKGKCTEEELHYLELYLSQYELPDEEMEKAWSSTNNLDFDKNKKSSVFRRIESDLEKEVAELKKSNSRKYLFFLKYAAVLIGIALIGFMMSKSLPEDNVDPQITIRLNDGSVKEIKQQEVLDIGGSKTVSVIKGDRLVYKNDSENTSTLEYNTVVIPNGRRLEIELSDGTLVFLNSGTTFKYPVDFLANQPREVFITGEAYFKVFHDPENRFIVNSNKVKTEVLGTKFNLRSFANDATSQITLLQGSVKLSYGLASSLLVANEVGIISYSTGDLKVEKVNTKDAIAWLDGYLLFKNETFQQIIPELERKYNVIIDNQNEDLAGKRFRGKFKTEKLEDILKTFSSASPFGYNKENNKITIKPN